MSAVELRSMAEPSGPTFKQWARKQTHPCEIIKAIIAVLIVLLFFCCYVVVFSIFKTEDDGNRSTTSFDDGLASSAGGLPRVNCTLSVDKIDYGIGVTMLLDCTTGLPDELVNESTLYLTKQVNVIVNRRSYSFKAGTIPNIISVPVSWSDGNLQDYPFDDYTAPIEVCRAGIARELLDTPHHTISYHIIDVLSH
jgi:hypothetical protein